MTASAGDIVDGLRALIRHGIRKGGGEADLRAAAPSFGMRLRRVRLPPCSRGTTPWWQRDQGPLLAFRQIDGGPVLLLPDRRGGYRLEETHGRSRAMDATLAATLSPDACAPVRAGGVEPLTPARWLEVALSDGRDDRMLALFAAAGCGVAAVLPVADVRRHQQHDDLHDDDRRRDGHRERRRHLQWPRVRPPRRSGDRCSHHQHRAQNLRSTPMTTPRRV